MNESIDHQARVVRVLENALQVEMDCQSACASCQLKNGCFAGNVSSKILIVQTPLAHFFSPGEKVQLVMKQSMGLKAVFFAYIIPFITVLTMLLVLLHMGTGELIAGSCALATLAVYYFILLLLKNKLDKVIVFSVKKHSDE